MPEVGQIALLILAIVLFAAGGALSLARLQSEAPRLRLAAKACLYWGVLVALAVLVWHAARRGNWRPLGDNFDTLIWLGLLLALFVLYTQRVHPLRGLDWFVLPISILLLIFAAIFGRATPHEYVDSTWSWVHRVSAYGGAVAFAIAGAVGGMFLLSSRRLRTRRLAPGPNLGSLERLERLTLAWVTLGFPLLTIGLITGLVRALDPRVHDSLGPHWYATPKVVLAFAVWVVYALVLHSPINPVFRGRKAAVLSVFGFLLMIGTIVATEFMKQ